jgi:hypothetical protein
LNTDSGFKLNTFLDFPESMWTQRQLMVRLLWAQQRLTVAPAVLTMMLPAAFNNRPPIPTMSVLRQLSKRFSRIDVSCCYPFKP